MDSKLYYLFAAVLAAICISCTCAKSVAKSDMDNTIDPYDRATWLETRDQEEEEDTFKNMLLMNLVKLSREGYLAPGVIKEPSSNVDKRGRWQGFCFRRTRSGRFLPYICWKGEARK